MKLYLKNIGKIDEASIDINGITVIGGENNTGKSTLGKSLFSIYNSFYGIQHQIRHERRLSIRNALQILYHYYWRSEEYRDINDYSEEIISNAEKYRSNPELLKEEINSFFKAGAAQRLFAEKVSIDDIVDRIIDILNISDDAIFNSVVAKKIDAEFNGQILNIYSESEGIISLTDEKQTFRIDVSEGSVSSEGCEHDLHTEAIYIDDPFVLDDVDFRDYRRGGVYSSHRNHLIYNLLMRTNPGSVVDEIVVENRLEKINKKILPICDGNIVRQKNGRLGYKVKNTDRILSVKNLSTGLKTFVILKTLLTNGTIEKNGIVILDEPEIHLHPEWQLLFAELIVLLKKEFGINILLNTHSPYFLRAIQVYSAKYEMSDICKYYLSEYGEGGNIYITDVTDSVDKIFVKLSRPLQILEDERCSID